MTAAWLPADWPAPPGVRALTTLRHGAGASQPPFDSFNLGNRHAEDGDDPAVVERNRAELIALAGLPSAPHWLRQVHGTEVFRATAPLQLPPPLPFTGEGRGEGTRQSRTGATHPNPAPEPEADAAVTTNPGAALAILTADCLPVLLCATDGSEVAAAHAGWRGLAAGVLEATLAAMRTPPEQVMAWLGPAAGPQHYEVGLEVYDAFVAADWSAGSAFTSTRPLHWRVDLYALARRRLQAAGISPANIHGGDLCTIAEPQRFYSHRRDRHSGRMASLVWIEPAH